MKATRTLYVRLEMSTDLPDHDAFYEDADGLSWAATWLECKLNNENTNVMATVYSNPQDMVLDLEERA